MSTKHYRCSVCPYSAEISDVGVDLMREHIKSAHVADRKLRLKTYVMVRSDPPKRRD